MDDKLVSAHLLISGMVQGVGYRWFVLRKAKEYDLKGYVKNLWDGDVEVEVEGRQSLIIDFAKELKIGSMSANVTDIKMDWGAFESKFKGFEIRY
jgi:acylphosphatase